MANLIAFGDSITAGEKATTTPNRYIEKLAAYFGATLTNNGTSGARINDPGIIDLIYAGTVYDTDSFTLLTGTNDMRTANTNVPLQEAYALNLQAALAWLSIPDGYKTKATAASTSGTWTNNPSSVYSGMGRKSYTIGSTMTFTTRGTTAYIGFIMLGTGAGEFSVTIDGVFKGKFSTRGSVPSRVDGAGQYGAALARIPNLLDTTHAVVITVTSPTNVANEVYIDWCAGNGIPGTKPDVWVGNCIQATPAGYAAYGGSNTAVGQFNNRISMDLNGLIRDGLNICPVDAVNSLDYSVDMFTDGLHPNDSGHDKLFQAFKSKMNTLTLPHTLGVSQMEDGKWITATYLSTWTDFGLGWPGVAYMKDKYGRTWLRGMAKSGTIGSTPMITLPIGFRPSVTVSVPVRSNNAFGCVEIYPSGEVHPLLGNSSHFCLDGISFPADC